MRIIAGQYRSRPLVAPKGMNTRPTLDQTREALFNILQGRVADTQFLDLYAGSGAVALEAISRGAESAVICDMSAKACGVIQENIDALGCQSRAKLLRMKDTAVLSALQKKGDAFDLIFLDPPYRMNTAPVCQMIMEYGLLKPEGMIVVEHDRNTPPDILPPLTQTDHREYGAAGLGFYQTGGETDGL